MGGERKATAFKSQPPRGIRVWPWYLSFPLSLLHFYTNTEAMYHDEGVGVGKQEQRREWWV